MDFVECDICDELLKGENADQTLIGSFFKTLSIDDWDSPRKFLTELGSIISSKPEWGDFFPYIISKISTSANPERFLINFERLLLDPKEKIGIVADLVQNPRLIDTLSALFTGSQFFTEIFFRSPRYYSQLKVEQWYTEKKDVSTFLSELSAGIKTNESYEEKADWLRKYQRGEILRIGILDLLGFTDLAGTTYQLSALADSLISMGLEIAAQETQISPEEISVFALGKLGGNELNYSSDIDLLLISSSNIKRSTELGQKLIEIISMFTSEGFLYRVDMRLRPWGSVGSLVNTQAGYLKYLNSSAHFWEKQALTKIRFIAGNRIIGDAMINAIEPHVYRKHPEDIRKEVFEMKRNTELQLKKTGKEWGEVKLGEGSIRDVEFVVQYIQLFYGEHYPEIHTGNTLEALKSISELQLIKREEIQILTDGYIFFRTIEHYLQIMHYQQTHALPEDSAATTYLAKRLGFRGDDPASLFVGRYEEHKKAVRGVFLSYLGNGDVIRSEQRMSEILPRQEDINKHISRMDSSYQEKFSNDEIKLHTILAENLSYDHLLELSTEPLEDNEAKITIVSYDFPGVLSIICGLLFVYGFSIINGHVFTYEYKPDDLKNYENRNSKDHRRQIIVDVFTVKAIRCKIMPELWEGYRKDLIELIHMMDMGLIDEARGALVKRVARVLEKVDSSYSMLLPVEIEVDTLVSPDYTVLHIDAPDTLGFLYEFTNALAYSDIDIIRVYVNTIGIRIQDTLFVSDKKGRKITSDEKIRELRAAVVLIKHFTHLLPHAPNPENALNKFRELLENLFNNPNWVEELTSIGNTNILNRLVQMLGTSQFLWEDFFRLQFSNLYPVVRDDTELKTRKDKKELSDHLSKILGFNILSIERQNPDKLPPLDNMEWIKTVNAFKDREMFRIDMRHILSYMPEFWDFAEELSDLAEVIIDTVARLIDVELFSTYGVPLDKEGMVCPFSICALGKFGGRELGFASDIELMFIYKSNGKTNGNNQISTAEYYEKFVERFVKSIFAKREGIFQIDLRLRPYGEAGSMAVSFESFKKYFSPSGSAWPYERQALTRLRHVNGDITLGEEIESLRDEFIYKNGSFDTAAMRGMREKQIRHQVAGGTINTKYSPGGLVDIEYLVQGLQMNFGGTYPEIRSTNIRKALSQMAKKGIITTEDYTKLRKAHTFLRWLIDTMRVVRGNAKDTTLPPQDSEEFGFLTRRMGLGDDRKVLFNDLMRYLTNVQEINHRLLDQ